MRTKICVVLFLFGLIACAAPGAQAQVTEWYKRACEIEKAEAAGQKGIDARWIKLIDEANKQKAPPLDRACLQRAYSDSLFGRSQFKQAEAMMQSAVKIAQESNMPVLASNIFLRLDRNDHFAWLQKPTGRRSSTYVEKALQFHVVSTDVKDEATWQLMYNRSMGDLLADNGEHNKARPYFEKALDQLKICPDKDDEKEILTSYTKSLIASQHGGDAIKLLVDAKLDPLDKKTLIYACREAFCKADPQSLTIQKRTRELLQAKKWPELEAYLTGLSSQKQSLASGVVPIDVAIEELAKPTQGSTFEQRLLQLADWNKHQPKSSNAKTAFGLFYKNYAWHARGTGYADSVTQEGWRLMEQRLSIAERYLNAVPRAQHNTAWYRAMATVALGQSWPQLRYDALIAECRKSFPAYEPIIERKAYWLMPKWHGNPGDTLRYLAEQGSALPANLSSILLARTIWLLPGDDHPISWSSARPSFESLVKAYPSSSSARGEFAIQALLNNDTATALTAFTQESAK